MSAKKKLCMLVAVGLLGTFTVGGLAVVMEEVEVSLDQVPKAVKETILREAAGAEIMEIERETKRGKTVFEAEFLRDGKKIEIKIAPDGTLLGKKAEDKDEEEEVIAFDKIPAAARKALQELAGGEKITKAERESKHGTIIYEAEWTVKGVEHEAVVTEDGTLIETEEVIPAASAPAAVRAAIAKHFDAKAKVVVEKKMIVVYEIEAKVNGKEKEILVFPTGRVLEHGDDDDDDDDDDD